MQQREFERVGDTQTIKVDTRILAAANCDLWEEVNNGTFREDLYWRLNVIPIYIPPLRDRKGKDVEELVKYFLQVYGEANDCGVHIKDEALDLLCKYDWPGNVRELQNYIERAVVMAEGDTLTVDLLPPEVVTGQPVRTGRSRQADLETLTFEVVSKGWPKRAPRRITFTPRL